MIPGIVAARRAAGGGGGTDPFIAFRTSVLNLTSDLSDPFNTWTAAGDAAVPGGKLVLDGAGDYIATPSTSNFDIGTDDFCCEAYVDLLSVPGSEAALMSRWGAGAYNFFFGFNNSRHPVLYYYDLSGTPAYPPLAVGFPTGEHHIAWYKSGGLLYIAVDGTPTAVASVASIRNISQEIRVGGTSDSGSWLNGTVRGERFTVGSSGGYGASAFTPPALPLSTS